MSTNSGSDDSAASPVADRTQGLRDRKLLQRVATAGLGAPVLIAAIWYGGWALLAVVMILCTAGAIEFRRLADAAGFRTSAVVLAGTLLFPLLAAAGRWDHAGTLVVGITLAAAAASLASKHRTAAPRHAAATALGVLYVGVLFAHMILMRDALGPAVTLAVVGLIWANDTAAYFAGGAWGRRRLAPSISPGKSIEGFLAGIAAAVGTAAVLALLMNRPVGSLVGIGLGVGLAAVGGDLWESLLKRRAGVKDSGALLPGHGGVLDRFDAILFGVPAGYYLWRWLM